MGIWIRSQDGKKLVEAKCISINEDNNIMADCGASETGFYMGLYPTEAEAKAVLDEIEDFIQDVTLSVQSKRNPIYHMPLAKEGMAHDNRS